MSHDQGLIVVAGLLPQDSCAVEPSSSYIDIMAGFLSYDSCDVCVRSNAIRDNSDSENDTSSDIETFPLHRLDPFLNNMMCENPLNTPSVCYASDFYDNIDSTPECIIGMEVLSVVGDITLKAVGFFYYGLTIYSCPYASALYIAQKILKDTGALDSFCANEENNLLGFSVCDILEHSSHAYLLYSMGSAVKLLIDGHSYNQYLKICSVIFSKAFFSTEAIGMPGVHAPVVTPYVLEKVSSELIKHILGTDAFNVQSEFLKDYASKTTGKVLKYTGEEVLIESKIPTTYDSLKISFNAGKKGLVLASCYYLFPYERGPVESQLNKYCNVLSNKALAYGELSSPVVNQTV